MKTPARQGSPNDFQTPAYAIKPLLPYIPKDWVVWECASGKGNLVKEFIRQGYITLYSDIAISPELNFMEYEPVTYCEAVDTILPIHYDVIVTNPPYSLKQQFLERAYSLHKPFAFLLPLTTFETKKRQELFKKYGLEVIFFDKRINFETPSGKGSSSWFATAWFTNGLNIGRQMTFEELKEE